LYADANGVLLRAVLSDAEEERFPDPPNDTAEMLEIDADTNPQIVAALTGHLPEILWQDVRLSGGILSYKGQPVTVAMPSAAYSERQQALTLARALKAYNGLSNPTQAQTVAAVKANNRLTLILGRLLLREVAGE
jgi:hypothetical protein